MLGGTTSKGVLPAAPPPPIPLAPPVLLSFHPGAVASPPKPASSSVPVAPAVGACRPAAAAFTPSAAPASESPAPPLGSTQLLDDAQSENLDEQAGLASPDAPTMATKTNLLLKH